MAGAPEEVVAGPVARHWLEVGQSTWSTDADPAGRLIALHEVAPSVVRTASALALGSDCPASLGPTATQVDELEQAIDVNPWVPWGTPTCDQVTPPSWLTRIPAPTATQVVALGQVTAPTPPEPVGVVSGDQLDPPSVVRRIAGEYGSSGLDVTPTARQVELDTQVTDTAVVWAMGRATSDHDWPPSELLAAL